MSAILINNTIKLIWTLDGYENYCFGDNKELYNIKTGKKIKHTIVNSTRGWCIGGKFMSEKKIKPLLKKVKA